MTDVQLALFDDGVGPRAFEDSAVPETTPDAEARAFAVDPRNNVVLEASAGTGKTSVLVSRYVNLVRQGVAPSNILAITFTRKAAAEMRERIVTQLRDAGARGEIDRQRWTELRDRLGEVAISTIDAFCLSLLREFPLEADLDPGFEMADETEVPRIVEEALDRSLRILVGLAREDDDIALVLAQLGISRAREGLAALLDRRLVAASALERFLARGPANLTPRDVCHGAAAALDQVLRRVKGGLDRFLADGPSAHGRYHLFRREVARLRDVDRLGDAEVRGLLERIGSHFLTIEGEPRRSGRIHPYVARDYPSKDAERRHRDALFELAPQVERVIYGFHRDLNVILARGVRRMFAVALQQYRSALEERAVLDFPDVLQRALDLLQNMGEFSQSRYRLECRYHHVLVDEFQDTSRAQWQLISLLIQAWGEGAGLAAQPSIFIVGDRKQSIYRFRDAEVSMLREAATYIDGLRPGAASRRSISRSFRAVPALQAFVNDVFAEVAQPADAVTSAPGRPDDFTYDDADRFPIVDPLHPSDALPLGIAVGDSPEVCAAAVAAEIRRILAEDDVRDRDTGVRRRARSGDIAILFRSRTSHREFERELIAHGLPTYVYKGLGFFDSDEIKDVLALLRYLANPASDLRAAALLRSRFIRLSDAGLAALAPDLAAALTEPVAADLESVLDSDDWRVLEQARRFVPGWIAQVDRLAPSELLEHVLTQTAYAYELRGARRLQAWENLKKMRGLVRRMQNRGYATMTRLADHLDALGAGEESNAVLEAVDSVNLMTIHASKGLEFPIVFLVNLARGASGPPHPVRVIVDGNTESVTVGRFATEMEEADQERDRHETRRLLYVAMTRARDRLYLSSSLKGGQLVPGRGSLADVLPDSIKPLFARAAGPLEGVTALAWRGTSGTSFEFRLCQTAAAMSHGAATTTQPTSAGAADDADRRVLGAPLHVPMPDRRSVTSWVSDAEDEEFDTEGRGSPSERITGVLIHRLLEHASPGSKVTQAAEEDVQLDLARNLLTPEERESAGDVEVLIRAAVDGFRRLSERPDVARVLASGARIHEAPFAFALPGSEPPVILRGRIDCLILRDDGSILVVDFKTGRPRASDRRQLDLYVSAVAAIRPAAAVEGLLIYL
jgi:ATP-dependent helicase/nuclease subunit A